RTAARNERRQRYGHQTGFRKSHSNRRRIRLGGSRPHNLTPPRWRRWRNFNPIWLKYSLQQELLQIYRNRGG
ncbi:hypothetical protein, partial [Mesorhizobium sp. M7A.F.Ca.CA.002.15.2.1]|uniref:hypothetical protein n=1 Tax=Mesorhizobium sp. M7A.F.Ca.CA.002.15.2.1 TaxID=2496678 RepID=UPI0019D1FF37